MSNKYKQSKWKHERLLNFVYTPHDWFSFNKFLLVGITTCIIAMISGVYLYIIMGIQRNEIFGLIFGSFGIMILIIVLYVDRGKLDIFQFNIDEKTAIQTVEKVLKENNFNFKRRDKKDPEKDKAFLLYAVIFELTDKNLEIRVQQRTKHGTMVLVGPIQPMNKTMTDYLKKQIFEAFSEEIFVSEKIPERSKIIYDCHEDEAFKEEKRSTYLKYKTFLVISFVGHIFALLLFAYLTYDMGYSICEFCLLSVSIPIAIIYYKILATLLCFKSIVILDKGVLVPEGADFEYLPFSKIKKVYTNIHILDEEKKKKDKEKFNEAIIFRLEDRINGFITLFKLDMIKIRKILEVYSEVDSERRFFKNGDEVLKFVKKDRALEEKDETKSSNSDKTKIC